MKKRTKRWLGGLALAAGALGAAGTYLTRKKKMKVEQQRPNPSDVWARPGMMVTVRAELMPGREREQRTFRVKELLSNGRVLLHGVEGEHAEREFNPVR